MSKSTIFELTSEEAVELEAAIEKCVQEVQQIREQMQNDQAEIDRLKNETKAILEELKAA